jgi:internalin A
MCNRWATLTVLVFGLHFLPTVGRADEEAALAIIKKFHGATNRDKKQPNRSITMVNLNDQNYPEKLTDADLAVVLKEFKGLQSLSLGGTKVTDASMKAVKEITTLKELYLGNMAITDHGLYEIRGLTGLIDLNLSLDKGVTDQGMVYFKNMKNLRNLALDSTKVTDAGLKEFKNVPSLTNLFLGGTLVTDAGLQELKDLPNLQKVFLTKTKITDAGLREFKNFKKLTLINVIETKVTLAGLKELKAAMPDLQIQCDTKFFNELHLKK